LVGGGVCDMIFLENVSENASRVGFEGFEDAGSAASCRRRKVGRETERRQFAPRSGRNLVCSWSWSWSWQIRDSLERRHQARLERRYADVR
jgi:hypothetical protein